MTQPVRTIVVGVATPDDSDPVLAPAIALARRLGATLHVVHAFDLPAPVQVAYARAVSLDPRLLERYAGELRDLLETRLRAATEGVPVVCHVTEGAPSECIDALAAEVSAELLVVGASRRGRIWRQFLGTTAEGVVRRASIPVLVVRHPLPRAIRRVLLTTDLSEASEDTCERGLDVVEALFGGDDPELRSLLVVQDSVLPFSLPHETLEHVAQRELDGFLRKLPFRGRAVQGRVRMGAAADEILAEAAEWQADLILTGTHGRSITGRLALGRVTGAILRGGGCNVLVVPSADQALATKLVEAVEQASVGGD